MVVRVGINGFGRIGRNVLRAIAESGRKDIEVAGINDLGPAETNPHLLRSRTLRAPLARGPDGTVGLQGGFMAGVHAYTGDQAALHAVHKDVYRGRAAAMSMIPASAGAAKAIGLVLPELKGKLDGVSIRVPT